MTKNRYVFCLLLALTQVCAAAPSKNTQEPLPPNPHVDAYLQLLKKFSSSLGPLGSWKNGEIEISTDPRLIRKIEKQTRLRLQSLGYSEIEATDYSSVGIVAEDNYWIWLRDGVIFPSGVYGTYDRLMWRASLESPSSVGVLPILKNKKILINLSYRHATRNWELELPRGQKQPNETVEEAAKRELMEETGSTVTNLVFLGETTPNAGMMAVKIPIYLASASQSGKKRKEFSEAISDNPSFTKEQLKEGFSLGYLTCLIQGKPEEVRCRDALLAYALFMAEIKGLL